MFLFETRRLTIFKYLVQRYKS